MLRRPRFFFNSIDTSAGEQPKADSYQNGSSRAADPTTSLTEKERATLSKMLANPLDFPQEFPGWLDDFVRLRLTASQIAGLGNYTGTTGELLVMAADYTAQTGVYTIEAKGGTWMYLNGATFDTAVYASLYAYLGTATLPDTRGRSLWLCGTHTATDLFNNDGVTESSRQPKHTHTVTIATASAGTPAGTVSITDPGHSHTVSIGANSGGGTRVKDDNAGETRTQATSSDTTGISATFSGSALSAHGHSGSTAGSGMSGSDAVAHIVIGSAFVHV